MLTALAVPKSPLPVPRWSTYVPSRLVSLATPPPSWSSVIWVKTQVPYLW